MNPWNQLASSLVYAAADILPWLLVHGHDVALAGAGVQLEGREGGDQHTQPLVTHVLLSVKSLNSARCAACAMENI